MGTPCGWSIEQCGCGSCWDNHSPATQARASALAIGLMWAATGRQFGLCEVTTRPANRRPTPSDPLYQTFPVNAPYGDEGGGLGIYPVLDSGTWRNLCSPGGCNSCTDGCQVQLPDPVAEIVEVRIDGIAVDADTYEVQSRRILVRYDDCWPTCQRFNTEVPGFEVTYLRGTPIPDNIQAALEILACEYAAACTGGECRLPQRLASLTRQGVEVTVAEVPPSAGGVIRTGIQTVDDAIASVNPFNRVARAEIYSPDMPQVRTTTWRSGS